MPSLKLDDHAMRLLEHERTVLGFLNRTAHTWEWELDLPRGEILFREPGTGRILFSSPVKLIGTYSQDSETFRFGWTDPTIPEDWQCVTALGRLRVTARGAGLGIFDSAEPIAMSNPTKALAWAYCCAGYLGAFSVFEARQDRQVRFLTIAEFPDSGLIERDIHTAMQIIEEGKLSFSLHQHEAVEAYLGKPSGAGGSNLADETLYWSFPQGQLRIQFAHHGQLISMDAELAEPAPEPESAPQPESAPTAPEPPKPLGLLGRLFGKRNG